MSFNVLLFIENILYSKGLKAMIDERFEESSCTAIYSKSVFFRTATIKNFTTLIIDYNFYINNHLFFEEFRLDNPIVNIILFSTKKNATNCLNYSRQNFIDVIFEFSSESDILYTIVKNSPPTFFNEFNQNLYFENSRTKFKLHKVLSEREYEVGLLLSKGETVSSISHKKNIAITTVSTYKKRIFEKTQVSNFVEMIELFKRSSQQDLSS